MEFIIMAWSRFQYWRRGKTVKPVLKNKPKGSSDPLVLHRIKDGTYLPSPYLEMIEKENKLLEKEVVAHKQAHPYESKLDYESWYRPRKSVFNKRIIKLEQAHWEHDMARVKLFREDLYSAFKVDVWEECLEACDGNEMEFYQKYEELVSLGKKN